MATVRDDSMTRVPTPPLTTGTDVPDEAARKEGRRHKNLTDGSEKPIGEWNRMEITCKGDTIAITLNHALVVPAIHLPALSPTGAIGLIDFKNPLEFRNIMIHELEADTKAAP